jgi:hypothetical protein
MPISSNTDADLPPFPTRGDRITRWLLIAIGIYSFALVSLLNVFLLGSGKTIDRAIILMADGLTAEKAPRQPHTVIVVSSRR